MKIKNGEKVGEEEEERDVGGGGGGGLIYLFAISF